jgi:hypothetical protein
VREQKEKYAEAKQKLHEAVGIFDAPGSHPHLEPALLRRLKEVSTDVATYSERGAEVLRIAPQEDPILDSMLQIFDGQIGDGYSEGDLKNIIKEGEKRYAAGIPPGFEDRKKPSERRKYGDLIVWYQLIDEVKRRNKPVIFVTAEKKEDWFEARGGNAIGPRPELIEEMYEKTGHLCYIYSPDAFLEKIGEQVGRPVSPEAIEEVRVVDTATVSNPGYPVADSFRRYVTWIQEVVAMAWHEWSRLEPDSDNQERARLLLAELCETCFSLAFHLADVPEGQLLEKLSGDIQRVVPLIKRGPGKIGPGLFAVGKEFIESLRKIGDGLAKRVLGSL